MLPCVGAYVANLTIGFPSGGIAQWQSIRLQIERSPVQLWLPPLFPEFPF